MGTTQAWDTMKEAITTYTGLSPTIFFTVVALGSAFYYVVSGIFGSSGDDYHNQSTRGLEEETKPLPPIQLGEVTEEELKAYDGSDPLYS